MFASERKSSEILSEISEWLEVVVKFLENFKSFYQSFQILLQMKSKSLKNSFFSRKLEVIGSVCSCLFFEIAAICYEWFQRNLISLHFSWKKETGTKKSHAPTIKTLLFLFYHLGESFEAQKSSAPSIQLQSGDEIFPLVRTMTRAFWSWKQRHFCIW